MSFPLAFLSLLIEALAGYPDVLVRRIGHPVIWIGRLIAFLDEQFNDGKQSDEQRRIAGVGSLVLIVLSSLVAGLAVERLAGLVPFGLALVAIVASSLLAQRSLYDHVAAVATALETDGVVGGRRAVAQIVGRDPEPLDEAGVARAAIESLAENFSDGIVAPAFWLGVAGLAGGAAYKAVNTADSMIGHKNRRYREFGWASARFDDLINLPASRLSALLFIAAAALTRGADARAAWRAVRADARNHRSPNAGWPEAAVAGALGLSLAGPRAYGGVMTQDAPMGAGGRREADASDIRRALRLLRLADALLMLLMGALSALTLAL